MVRGTGPRTGTNPNRPAGARSPETAPADEKAGTTIPAPVVDVTDAPDDTVIGDRSLAWTRYGQSCVR